MKAKKLRNWFGLGVQERLPLGNDTYQDFVIVLWVYWMLSLGEAGWKVQGNVTVLYNFYVSLNLFLSEKLKKIEMDA